MSIIIDGISKKYGNKQVLNGFGISISEGTCTGFTGRNGCGKTTFLSILAGVETADSGRIVFPEKNYSIGYLPQINPLLENRTVKDNLKLWSRKKDVIERTAKQYDLMDLMKTRVGNLSGGMKRRLAIACALINEPKLLIMDEPTAALDVVYKQIIHQEMRDYLNRGGTIIMVTHEKEEMEMCNACYYIEDGRVAKRYL